MPRAANNRTLYLSRREETELRKSVVILNEKQSVRELQNKTICGELCKSLEFLPSKFVNLLIVDPPYNLDKNFRGKKFSQLSDKEYTEWLEEWVPSLLRILKPNASAYFCGDWRTSISLYNVLSKYFTVRNRITWEREKGRGAKSNWKNNCEDIWFCTVGEEYTFNVDTVKLKKRVLAPYRKENGTAKDWKDESNGKYRLTYPSNIWTDISIPFWSMKENTEHPTQKPEKLIAKLVLASSNPKDLVFDPFLGSGTTSVVAKKLNRRYLGVEFNKHYCALTEKRLLLAAEDSQVQGYKDGVFWERNSAPSI